jgi:hypothetical protein
VRVFGAVFVLAKLILANNNMWLGKQHRHQLQNNCFSSPLLKDVVGPAGL